MKVSRRGALAHLFATFIGGMSLGGTCQDQPKNPVPCTGQEQWPDPCAPGAITETTTDASATIPMQPDPPTRKPPR